jgi:putrescine transport system substrate-binding protein
MLRVWLLILLMLTSLVGFAEDKTVYIYNWAEYFAPDTLKNFTKKSGIKVVYDVFDSEETVETKLMVGNTGYDVVFVQNSPFFARQLDANIFMPLDTSKLPHLKQIKKSFLPELTRGGKLYGTPYMWSSIGIGYDAAKTKTRWPAKAPVDSWALFMNPDYLKSVHNCGVAVLDAPNLVYPAVLKYLGLNPATTNIADYEKATDALMKIRPYITYFHNSQYLNDIANGSICFAVGWSGDLTMARKRARESKNGVDVHYFTPKEGSIFSFDVMTIPKDAKHPDLAYAIMDYLMSPEVLAPITEYVTYPNANPESDKLIDPKVRKDPSIYPPESTMKELFNVPRLTPKMDREVNRLWTRLKSGV